MTKSVDNLTPSPGQNVTWTVTITNNGPNPANSIVVTDILPDGVTYVSDNPEVGDYDAGKNNSDWQWTGFALNAFPIVPYSRTLEIVTRVDTGTEGKTITNDAFFTSADVPDADDSNNVGSASIAVSGTDLRITKTATPDYPSVGDTVTFILTAFNDGPNAAAGVVVDDLLPPELSYIGDSSGGSYDSLGGVWTVGSLATGTSSQIKIQGLINKIAIYL